MTLEQQEAYVIQRYADLDREHYCSCKSPKRSQLHPEICFKCHKKPVDQIKITREMIRELMETCRESDKIEFPNAVGRVIGSQMRQNLVFADINQLAEAFNRLFNPYWEA